MLPGIIGKFGVVETLIYSCCTLKSVPAVEGSRYEGESCEQRKESINVEKELNMNRHWIGLIQYLRSMGRVWVVRRR